MSNLQHNVNRILKAANCTVTDLAAVAGVHRRTVDRVRGNSSDAQFGYTPKKETIDAFTNLFGAPATSRLKAEQIQEIADSLF